ncbi:MAG TPA: hypothetical protein VFO85_09710, partial [Vicinamibacteria bacterium]|nr:hypothetical protein [Vicinamibacteria bacterium]
MRRRSFGLPEVLDEAAETVAAVAAPFLGVVWLTSLPLRLAQCHFAWRLWELGGEAAGHGAYLAELALIQTALLVPWAWGRAVFVRACRLGLRGQPPGAAALRVGAVPFAGYLYVTVLLETIFWATAWTFVTLPALVLMGALAAATHPLIEKPGLLAPLKQLFRHGAHGLLLSGLLVVLGWALVVAAVNLHVLFQAGVWLAGAVPGLDPGRWRALLHWRNGRYLLAVVAGAVLALEPYLLAAMTVYVHKVRSRGSGEDLRL